MPIRRADPLGSGRSRPDSFSYFWTPPDQPWNGWVAGDAFWIEGHTSDKPTKPCLEWMTYRSLSCPWCQAKIKVEKVGYLPIYREIDCAPILCIVHDNMGPTCNTLKHGSYVRLSRPGGPKGTLAVHLVLAKKRFAPGLPRRKVPVDLTDGLLGLWKINELTEWYKCTGGESGQEERPKVDATKITTESEGNVVFPKMRLKTILNDNAAARERTAAAMRTLADGIGTGGAPSANGKHE